ncbi:L-ascorbate metabolism protein UlaG (beta-lactamase superfamily) [Litoreibacter meonggei]|uniref:L-ascorbate metabolism protein UlaG (Beta-lactamase superfamily) n=1 Tax=Litoreibacter meonggei TaxID=1049199 RepID=A0A497X5Q7_9RHOB|nr:MBL fold metallo-hydrolase [Litoreibacter meonggei]RLJ60626.1 L-ascorbate metabolism protein UlaG (beta-lactamase superfamily) [Litoreibacter meonggei]
MRWVFLFLMMPLAALAQDRRPSHCIALADAPGVEYIKRAAFGEALDDYTVRLSYIAHATFILETSGGLTAATDYTGFFGVRDFVPDVVTMNHAHSSHWTPSPDPRIKHVLRGWQQDHHLDLGEMLVRNVSTDIRGQFSGDVEKNGNSIFVFEVAGLCIGHLGHLHHEPDQAQYAALGRLDVVMAPVDGGLTLDLPTMVKVLKRLKSSVVIPMHWWADGSLGRFVAGMSDEFAIDRRRDSSLEVSLRTLPKRPTVITLRPAYLRAAIE